MTALVLFSAALALYHYAGYPLLVGCIARFKRSSRGDPRLDDPPVWPTLTLLIAAYNEEKVILGKLRNALALDYPRPIEIIVVSDGSSDATPALVESLAADGVVSMHRPARRGKTAALNRGVARASGEIVVFSDANNHFSADALRMLVRHFVDPAVGGCCGAKHILEDDARESSRGDGLYWRYESAIKLAEGRIGSITNADGEIFAIRRNLWRPVDERIINDDAQITFDIVDQGKRVLYEPAARSSEYASIRIEDDFHVKVRMVAGGFQTIALQWRRLLPPRSWFAWAYVSHKVLRYVMPLFLLLILGGSIWNAALGDPLFRAALALQLVFAALAAIGFMRLRRHRLPTILYVPFYFCAMNLAALVGLARYLVGRQGTNWRRAQR